MHLIIHLSPSAHNTPSIFSNSFQPYVIDHFYEETTCEKQHEYS